MKQRELLAHLQRHGCSLLREGSRHSIWHNPQTGSRETIPRHHEIKRGLARAICRSLSVPVPKGA